MSNKVTLLPDYIDIVQQPDIEFYRTSTDLLSSFSTYLGELNTSIEFEKAKSSVNITNSISKIYKTLNDNDFKVTINNKEYEFDQGFKLHFIEKYQTLYSTLRDFISGDIGKDNIYFVNYSDDVGMIADETSIVDNSTSPFYDTYDTAFSYPTSLPASLFNKVSLNEKSSDNGC